MGVVTNAKHLFREVPTGYPEPGKTTVTDTSETIDLDNVPLDGGALIKTLILSIDPYLRNKMRDATRKMTYTNAFKIGEPLYNYGVGLVLRSEDPSLKPGNHVYGMLKFMEYNIETDVSQFRVLPEDVGIPWNVYVGALGMPGSTAFSGWKEFSKAKPGEVAFITTGAGPVGSFVIQLAKQDGLKVIASAGSEAKVQFMKDIGADVAFNYKTTSTREVLEIEGPIDVYWDNVGGETLEAALEAGANHARFIECGMITNYNSYDDPNAKGVRNLNWVYRKNMVMSGFVVSDIFPKYQDEFYEIVPRNITEGKIKYKEHLYHGLDSAGQAMYDIQTGANEGKVVIVVAEE